MAKFNPDQNVGYGKEYDFKGVRGNTSIGQALSGLAEVGDSYIKAQVRADTSNIRKEARETEESIQDTLFNTSKVAAAQASTTAAGQALPEDLAKGIASARKLKEGYLKGSVRESDYLANIDVLAKKMRAKWGVRYADEIDSAIAGAMSNTANQFRKELFGEFDKQATAANDELKAKWAILNANEAAFYNRPDLVANIATVPKEELYMVAARYQGKVAEATHAKTVAELAALEGANGIKTRVKVLKDLTGFLVDEVRVGGHSLGEQIQKAIAKGRSPDSPQGGGLSKEEQDATLAIFSDAKVRMLTAFNKLREDYTDLPDEKVREAESIITNEIKVAEDLINDKQYGLFTYNVTRQHQVTHDAAWDAVNNDPNLRAGATTKMTLDFWGLTTFASDKLQDFMNKAKPINETTIKQFVRSYSRPGAINEQAETLAASDGDDPKPLTDSVEMMIEAIEADSVDDLGKRNTFQALFSPKYRNGDFIGKFSPEGRVLSDGSYINSHAEEMYYKIMTPKVIAEAKKLQGTDQETWRHFKNWGVDQAFGYLFEGALATAAAADGRSKISFDPTRMRFLNTKEPVKADRSGGVPHSEWRAREVIVNRMNNYLDRAIPLLQADGLEPHVELLKIIEARGVQAGTLGWDFFSALRREKEKEDAKEDTK